MSTRQAVMDVLTEAKEKLDGLHQLQKVLTAPGGMKALKKVLKGAGDDEVVEDHRDVITEEDVKEEGPIELLSPEEREKEDALKRAMARRAVATFRDESMSAGPALPKFLAARYRGEELVMARLAFTDWQGLRDITGFHEQVGDAASFVARQIRRFRARQVGGR